MCVSEKECGTHGQTMRVRVRDGIEYRGASEYISKVTD